MPLSPSTAPRELMHNRKVECQGYRRADGLWEIEGRITDHKTYSFVTDGHQDVPLGTALHDMSVRLVLTNDFEVKSVEAITDHAPYPATCPQITPDYKKLEGLQIGPGWSRAVKERLGGAQGCTHITELLGPMATTAFQTIYPILAREERERNGPDAVTPRHIFLLNTCHNFRSDGEVIKNYAPEYYTGEK